MPLIEPVAVVPAAQLGAVHFIAAGGAGMSGIAAMYAELGVPTSGSDQVASPALAALTAAGVRTFVGHDPAQLGAADTVVVSSAVRETNPELAEARRRGLRVWHRSAALAALMVGRRGVAVTGTHGKTTTSAMIATLLAEAGADPSYVVGSPLTGTGRSYRLGAGEAFVVEADESDGSFRQYPAEIVVITNVEADHLDNWGTAENYAAGFVALATADAVRAVVLSADDPGARALAPAIRASGKQIITFGESVEADVRLSDVGFVGRGSTAQLSAADDAGDLALAVPGRYNLLNAAAAYAVGRLLGVPGPALRAAAGRFAGTARRFQPVGEVHGVRVFDDYAHHPTEVTATLTAARAMVGQGRLVACFQPHLFTRTRDFADEFGQSLSLADHVVVLGIYPAREDPIPGVTGELVATAVRSRVGAESVSYAESVDDGVAALAAVVRPGDLVVTIGAGSVTQVGPRLCEALNARPVP
ncbi:MAG: UDP-N-acetylmuramate--L-alanine ligase [Actinobacteria bacterium HGW-Actinobacteria-2]|nr:MAG: UDP-N-acetylmuramate--L-alanine ligase [Actinobacteria bacterium HGW-Actinobacteria-2]